jgi:hypothetical protein
MDKGMVLKVREMALKVREMAPKVKGVKVKVKVPTKVVKTDQKIMKVKFTVHHLMSICFVILPWCPQMLLLFHPLLLLPLSFTPLILLTPERVKSTLLMVSKTICLVVTHLFFTHML